MTINKSQGQTVRARNVSPVSLHWQPYVAFSQSILSQPRENQSGIHFYASKIHGRNAAFTTTIVYPEILIARQIPLLLPYKQVNFYFLQANRPMVFLGRT